MINCKHFKFLHCPECNSNGFNLIDGYIICSECGLVIKSVECYDNFETADFKVTDKKYIKNLFNKMKKKHKTKSDKEIAERILLQDLDVTEDEIYEIIKFY